MNTQSENLDKLPGDPCTALPAVLLNLFHLCTNFIKKCNQFLDVQSDCIKRERESQYPNTLFSTKVSVHVTTLRTFTKFVNLKRFEPLGPPCTVHGSPGIRSWTIGSCSKFDGPQLCSSLTYRDPQYLYEKI